MFTTDQRRQLLQGILESTLGSSNVYFQPPASVSMQYPAIVYQWDQTDTDYADDIPYRRTRRYQVTVIAKTATTDIPDKVAQLPLCAHTRFFVANNLNHYVFTLYH